MTARIVALVDGSIYSASVCELAGWASGRMGGASVDLLHVLGRREASASADLSGSIQLGARSALLAELADLDEQRARLVAHRGRAILDDAKALLDKAGVAEVTTSLRHGDLLEELARAEAAADLVLVGKRGEAADFAKGHLGSNIERIARASHKPLLVAARAFQPLEKVIVAYDGEAPAMKAIDHIARSPMVAGLSVEVVTVAAETPEVTARLADARAMLAAAGLAVETRVLPGQPAEAIGKLVEETGPCLLVMGAHGRRRLRRLFIGSTTTEMIRTCKVPVLLVR